MKKILILLALSIVLVSCKKNKAENSNCFSDVATTRVITDKQAFIYFANNQYFIVEKNTIDTRLIPCTLADEFKTNNLQRIISGEVKNYIADGGPCCAEGFIITKITR
jgi:hypothetical protein